MFTISLLAATIALVSTPDAAPRVTFDRAACEAYDDGASYLVCRAGKPAVSERLCAEQWERDGDAWWSCVVGLESWRCEVQGWCDGGASVVEAMPTVDVQLAGSVDWDAI